MNNQKPPTEKETRTFIEELKSADQDISLLRPLLDKFSDIYRYLPQISHHDLMDELERALPESIRIIKGLRPDNAHNCHEFAFFYNKQPKEFLKFLDATIFLYSSDGLLINSDFVQSSFKLNFIDIEKAIIDRQDINRNIIFATKENNEYKVRHSAIITSIDNGKITCLSMWGIDGEIFEHRVFDIPHSYGSYIAIIPPPSLEDLRKNLEEWELDKALSWANKHKLKDSA